MSSYAYRIEAGVGVDPEIIVKQLAAMPRVLMIAADILHEGPGSVFYLTAGDEKSLKGAKQYAYGLWALSGVEDANLLGPAKLMATRGI